MTYNTTVSLDGKPAWLSKAIECSTLDLRRFSFETVGISYARKAAHGGRAVSCGGMQ
jgi:hypothetical protein